MVMLDSTEDVGSWTVDMLAVGKLSERRAWRLVFTLAVFCSLLILALIMLLPLKSMVPYVVVLDKLNGQEMVLLPGVKSITNSEVMVKHWVSRFVMARERYDSVLLRYDYDVVRRLADESVWRAYAELFGGQSGLLKEYGDRTVRTPTIVSIAFLETGLVQVQLELAISSQDKSTVDRKKVLATLRYRFDDFPSRSEGDLVANPLGFRVTSYRLDSQFVHQSGPNVPKE